MDRIGVVILTDRSLNAFRVLMLSVFMAMVGLGIISPIMPNYASDLGASGIYIGLIYSSFSFSRVILQTPVGRLADTFSKKKIIVAGLIMYTIISVVYTYVTSPEMLIVVRVFHGVGSSMMMPVAMAYAMNLTPKGEEGKYMGYMNTALFSGFGAGPFIGGYIYENIVPGWSSTPCQCLWPSAWCSPYCLSPTRSLWELNQDSHLCQ